MTDESIKDESIKDESKESYIKPSLDEMYAIILKGDKPCVYQVSEISETSNVVIMNAVSKKGQFIFELENEYLVLDSKSLKYSILDIERVIPFDLDILKKDVEQLQKLLTSDIVKELDISLEEIKDKDIIYTIVELKEMLLSEFIHLYDAYDKYSLIKRINDIVDEYIVLMKDKDTKYDYTYNLHNGKSLPKWLIPVANNPLKLYINGEEDDKAFDELNDINDVMSTNNNYYQNIQSLLDSNRPIESSISDTGVATNIHHSNYLRDCLHEDTCIGLKGNYKYDRRNNKSPYSLYYDGKKDIIHLADTLNIVGLLYIPDNHLIQGYAMDESFTMQEKTIIQDIININSRKLLQLKNLPMITKTLDENTELSDLDSLIHYSINDRYDVTQFNDLLTSLIPSIQQLLSTIDEDISSKLINYNDIKTIFTKYNLDPEKLPLIDKNIINELITSNIKEYQKNIHALPKVNIRINIAPLTNHQKMQKSKDIIMNMLHIRNRNEYLLKFIKVFTRESITNENNVWLYNIITNEPLLCKHYLYSSIYHKDHNAFVTLKTVYGNPPEDGIIYCKHCGEYLCDEEFSEFEGFNDEQPVVLRAVMDENIDFLKGYKEPQILLVKLIGKNIGVSLEDSDIKLILDIYNSLDAVILSNTRYSMVNIADTDEHPLVKDIHEKYKKDKNKKKLIQRDNKEFQSYLKDTNKIVGLMSLIILVIQTSIPTYNMKNNMNFTFLEYDISDELTFNKQTIDYCLHKIFKNIELYKTDDMWKRYNKLINEHKTYDLPSTKEQILNVVQYLISPLFPSIQKRINDYKIFINSTNQEYIKPEWVLFKPLRHNKSIRTVDTLLMSKMPEHKPHFILNYNNYPVENVSLLESINNDTLTYELLKIPISEIMINNSFILLFKICVSNYGINKGYINSVNLHINSFINTITDKDAITGIFSKHGFKESHISYKLLRTKIIPDIISHYQKSKQDLEACYSNESICNRFIHININNYELCLVKGNPKRHYKYIAPNIYPDSDFDDISVEFKDKLFKRYCKDPSGNIISKYLTALYLGKVIINISGEVDIDIPDTIRDFEKELNKDVTNFKDILQSIQSRLLPLPLYYKPKHYAIDDYNIDIYKRYSYIERNILEVFKENQYYELGNDHPIIHHLSNYIEYIQGHDNIDNTTIKRDFGNAFSLLITDDFIDSISIFISQCSSTPHKKRLENIFINTTESINISHDDRHTLEGDGFRYKNLRQQDIKKILELFSNDNKLTSDIFYNYIYRIKYILSNCNNKSESSPYIPKHWKLSDTNRTTYKKYIEGKRFVLHKDIFKVTPLYNGFYDSAEPYICDSLLDYISPYMVNLYKLKTNSYSLIDPIILFIIYKYILLFIIHKLIEFHSKLQDDDEEVISLIESKLRKHDIDTKLDMLSIISSVEATIMDLLTEILQIHYDSRWIVSNMNKNDLVQRLSKQREREKQTLIQKLDTMSDDKRTANRELQNMGITNQFKASAEKNAEYMESEDRDNATVLEQYNTMNENFKDTELEQYVNDISTGESSIINPYISIDNPLHNTYNNANDENDENEQMDDEMNELLDEDLLD